MSRNNKKIKFLIKQKFVIHVFLIVGLLICSSSPAFSSDITQVTVQTIVLESNEEGYMSTESQITVDPTKPNIVLAGTVGGTGDLSSITIPNTVSDEGEVILNLELMTEEVAGKVRITIDSELTITRDSSISANNFEVVISAGTVIQDTDGSWNSNFLLPTVNTEATENPPESNNIDASVSKVLDIGSSVRLVSDNAIKIKLPSQGGKRVGYVENGSFTEITTTCENNTNPSVASGAECKITVVSDLFVWTKHLTEFIAYSYPTPEEEEEEEETTGSGGSSVTVPEKFKGEVNVLINNDDEVTKSRTVTLALTGGEEVRKMIISNSSDFVGISQDIYTKKRIWLLTPKEGKKTVYVKFFNSSGQASQIVKDTIILEFPKLKEEAKEADLDADNVVGLFDFNLIMVNWGPVDIGNLADINQDEMVDIFDLNLIFVHWTM